MTKTKREDMLRLAERCEAVDCAMGNTFPWPTTPGVVWEAHKCLVMATAALRSLAALIEEESATEDRQG